MNKVIKKVKLKEGFIKYPYLGSPGSWKVCLFSDASFANLPDGVSSAMAYIVFLVGNAVCPLQVNAPQNIGAPQIIGLQFWVI